MLNRFLLNMAASQLGNKRSKPPWEEKSNYRDSKRGYHSNCHLWRNKDEVDDVRNAIWEAKSKKTLPASLSLIGQCGSDVCVRGTHLKPASASDIEFIDLLREERKDWKYNMGSIRLLAKSMHWDENEISLVLRIPRTELKEMLENGLKDDVPYGQRGPGTASSQPESSSSTPAPQADQRQAHVLSESVESQEQSTGSAGVMPALPPIPAALNHGPLGNPTDLVAGPGDAAGKIALRWTPAANATHQCIYFHSDGGAEAEPLPDQIPGDCDGVTLSGVESGRYRFILIACQKFAENEEVVWSEWSNWASVALEEGAPSA